MTEIWKDVPGYDGMYQVSNFGRIKSFRTSGRKPKLLSEGRIIKPTVCKNGYLEAAFCQNNTRKMWLLHRLVAMVFIPNPNNYPEVNHKDENIKNCRVDNLEWCTSKYNANYGTRNKRMMLTRVLKPVNQYTLDGKFVKKWDSISDAGRFYKVDGSAITRVCKGKQNHSRGYVWKYA